MFGIGRLESLKLQNYILFLFVSMFCTYVPPSSARSSTINFDIPVYFRLVSMRGLPGWRINHMIGPEVRFAPLDSRNIGGLQACHRIASATSISLNSFFRSLVSHDERHQAPKPSHCCM